MMQSDELIAGQRQRVPFDFLDLGYRADYKQVWDLQKQIVEKLNLGQAPNTLIVVEHAHVNTIGRNGHMENILGGDLPLFSIERGGDVTYHGPGQLVAYPILSLTEYSLGVRQYVDKLEQVLIESLRHFGIAADGRLGDQTGVWVGDRKIASIGVATSHWITYHGFALNVSTDLSYFRKIRPCGFESSVMTSMEKELGVPVEISKVKNEVISSFSNVFEADVRQQQQF